jgi:hypothetical protein
MPNLYFWEPDNPSHWILRAVLSCEDCDRVVDRASAIHLGGKFPGGSMNRRGHGTVAILYVHPDEANVEWLAGYYRIDTDVTEIHECVRTLNRIPGIVRP